jgi:hypothetical protein
MEARSHGLGGSKHRLRRMAGPSGALRGGKSFSYGRSQHGLGIRSVTRKPVGLEGGPVIDTPKTFMTLAPVLIRSVESVCQLHPGLLPPILPTSLVKPCQPFEPYLDVEVGRLLCAAPSKLAFGRPRRGRGGVRLGSKTSPNTGRTRKGSTTLNHPLLGVDG